MEAPRIPGSALPQLAFSPRLPGFWRILEGSRGFHQKEPFEPCPAYLGRTRTFFSLPGFPPSHTLCSPPTSFRDDPWPVHPHHPLPPLPLLSTASGTNSSNTGRLVRRPLPQTCPPASVPSLCPLHTGMPFPAPPRPICLANTPHTHTTNPISSLFDPLQEDDPHVLPHPGYLRSL